MNWRAALLALRGDHVVIPVETHAGLLRRIASYERRSKAQKDARAARLATPLGHQQEPQ